MKIYKSYLIVLLVSVCSYGGVKYSHAAEHTVRTVTFDRKISDNSLGEFVFNSDWISFGNQMDIVLTENTPIRLVNRSRSDLWLVDIPTICTFQHADIAVCSPIITSMPIPGSSFFGDEICMIVNPVRGPTARPTRACTKVNSPSRPTLTCDVRQPTLIDLGEVENKGPNELTYASSTGGHSFDVSCNGVATLRLDIQGAQWKGGDADNCTAQPIVKDGVVITIEGICPKTKLNTDFLNGAMKVEWYMNNPVSGDYQENVIFNLNYD